MELGSEGKSRSRKDRESWAERETFFYFYGSFNSSISLIYIFTCFKNPQTPPHTLTPKIKSK